MIIIERFNIFIYLNIIIVVYYYDEAIKSIKIQRIFNANTYTLNSKISSFAF